MGYFQNKVFLEPIKHEYWNLDFSKQYTPASKVLDSVTPKEDWNSIAGKIAGRGKFSGLNKGQVLKLWSDNAKKSTDHGTRIHKSLENFSKDFTIHPEDQELEEMIRGIHEGYKDYYRSFDEECLYSEYYGVAGTSDKMLQRKRGSKQICIADYKTSLSKGKITYHNKDGKYLLGPVAHLQDCSYVRYCLQESIYGVLYEELTGGTVEEMWVTFIPADNPKDFFKIPAVYMRTDAINILEHFKSQKEKVAITEYQVVEEDGMIEVPNF